MPNKTTLLLTTFIFTLTGCSTSSTMSSYAAPKPPDISLDKALSFEQKNLGEYAKLPKVQENVMWIQASNKKEPCKLYQSYSDNNYPDTENVKRFWDGDCKDGYAHGLGREFARGDLVNMDSLAHYTGGQSRPKYYINQDNVNNVKTEGDISAGYAVITEIKDNGFDFNIRYIYGYSNYYKEPRLLMYTSPFKDYIVYQKIYPNFHYQIADYSQDEFEQHTFRFQLLKDNKADGVSFDTLKSGPTGGGVFIDGALARKVTLPLSYYNHIENIMREINEAGQKAINAQKNALNVKNLYMKKVCKKSVKVRFMDNEEYKAICNEKKYLAELKQKMDAQLAEIKQEKDQKRAQLREQELHNARVRQSNAAALAASRQSAAMERSAEAAEYSSIMQGWQNINNNIQMQQLNNNLMMMRLGY